ncbi:MAG: sigma-70 family RNA polymerase sigma factor [Acutalibacteraceae bacterium]|nr:sigma-70 family RNA polymerase sigma factor [Acutalibacteraceae bacterium]
MLVNKEEEFIKENLGLVHSCCRRFTGRNIEYDDLFQAGCVGLLKASRDFDETRGFMFSTYAVPVILGEIKRLFRDGGAIKVSRSLKELSLKVVRMGEQFEKQKGRAATVSELAEMLSVTTDEINEAICVSTPPTSLTYYDENGIKEKDLPTINEEEKIYNRLDIGKALEDLCEIEQKIVFYRFFCGYTQNRVALTLNMTQVQVSRKEKKIMEKMRKKLD